LALDWSNTLYISDARNNRVQKYLRGASFGETIAGQANGSGGSTNYTLLFPTDVALKINGDIYVVDRNNNRVQLWTSGSSTGVTVAGTAGKLKLNILAYYYVAYLFLSVVFLSHMIDI